MQNHPLQSAAGEQFDTESQRALLSTLVNDEHGAPPPTYDLDEVFDRLFSRPVAAPISAALLKTPVSANQVTVVVGMFGLAAGYLMTQAGPLRALGAFCLLSAMVLDCCDGDIARVKGGSGWRGRIYDGLADSAGTLAAHAAFVYVLATSGLSFYGVTPPWYAYVGIAVLAFLSFMWNSGTLDGLKQRLKPSEDEDVLAARASVKGPFDYLVYLMMRFYLKQMAASSGPALPDDYARYRKVQFVGPTHHHLAMVIAAFAAAFWSPLALLLYFVVAIVPMNLYLAIVMAGSKNNQSELAPAE